MGVCILCAKDGGRQVTTSKFYVCFNCVDMLTEKKNEDLKPPPKRRPKTDGLIDLREFMDMRWGIWPGQEDMIPRWTIPKERPI